MTRSTIFYFISLLIFTSCARNTQDKIAADTTADHNKDLFNNDSLSVKKEEALNPDLLAEMRKQDSSLMKLQPDSSSVLTSKKINDKVKSSPGFKNFLKGSYSNQQISNPTREGNNEINYFETGVTKFNEGDYKGCIDPFTKDIEMNPGDVVSYYKRGQARIETGDIKGAIEDFTKAIELNPSIYSAYIKRGIAEVHIGEFNKAKDDFIESLKHKVSLEALMNLADIKFKMSDYSGAITDYTSIIDQKLSHSSDVYYRRGLAEAEYGKYQESIQDFSRAIELFPNYADAYLQRGHSEIQLKNYTTAIADLTKVIQLRPRDKDGYYSRGVAKSHVDDLNGAIVDFSKAIDIDPKYEQSYFQRAEILGSLGKITEAIIDLTSIIKLDPGSKEAYYNRGQFFLGEGSNQDAINDFTKVTELDPKDAEGYYYKGLGEANTKNFTGSCLSFKIAKELGHKKASSMMTKTCK
jgi:tetratricopeptide (TPR) repeat protein